MSAEVIQDGSTLVLMDAWGNRIELKLPVSWEALRAAASLLECEEAAVAARDKLELIEVLKDAYRRKASKPRSEVTLPDPNWERYCGPNWKNLKKLGK